MPNLDLLTAEDADVDAYLAAMRAGTPAPSLARRPAPTRKQWEDANDAAVRPLHDPPEVAR